MHTGRLALALLLRLRQGRSRRDHRHLDGLYVEAKSQVYVPADLNPSCTSAGYVPKYPYELTKTVSGYTTSSDKALKLSTNEILLKDTQFTAT